MPEDFDGFVKATGAARGTEILLLKARLAAEDGDETEALRLVQATGNLASHFHAIDHSSLLCETIAIMIDLSVRKEVFEHMLPVLGKTADLKRWKEALEPREYSPASFARVMRGEWHTGCRYLLYPMILDPANSDAPKDARALARAHAYWFSSQIALMEAMELPDLLHLTLGEYNQGKPYNELSSESRAIADMFLIGARAWSKGYVRSTVKVAQFEAAMDLLILEKENGTH